MIFKQIEIQPKTENGYNKVSSYCFTNWVPVYH